MALGHKKVSPVREILLPNYATIVTSLELSCKVVSQDYVGSHFCLVFLSSSKSFLPVITSRRSPYHESGLYNASFHLVFRNQSFHLIY